MWLGAMWLVLAVSGLWRDRVEAEAADAIREVAGSLNGEVQPCFCGFRVCAAETTVTWRGGLAGLVTRVHKGRKRARATGLLDAEAVQGLLG